MSAQLEKRGEPSSPPLERRPSRLTSALSHVKSIEQYPPPANRAHFEDDDEDEQGSQSATASVIAGPPPKALVVDIEHVPVDNDPREWSTTKKNIVLAMMTIAVLGPLMAPSIYNPVIDEVKQDLKASDTQIGLSVSLYILFQGAIPILWASTAELIGRRTVYTVSYGIYTIACLIASRASNMRILIAFRVIQAVGSAAVVSVGAGSLADMYEPRERGRKVIPLGIFYGMPLLGPALGPLIGGGLGNAFGWRSALYFLTAFAGLVWVMFFFFPDTWRKERSRVYQAAMERAIRRSLHAEEKKQRKLARGLDSSAPTPPPTNPATPSMSRRTSEPDLPPPTHPGENAVDVEAGVTPVEKRRAWYVRYLPWVKSRAAADEAHADVRPGIKDVNPLPTMWSIFHTPANAVVVFSSGLMFSGFYTITYTASVTLARAPYNYNSLIIGVVILAFGVGSMVGSLVGGRWSDWILAHLKKRNNGVSNPEMRLKSTFPAMPLMVGGFLTYAWTAGEHTNVAGIVVALFLCGLSIMLCYSSTLAYIVDANPGRSAAAVSCNSLIRGIMACICSQVSLPLQNALGDGGLYSLFAGLLALSSAGLFIVGMYGDKWRQAKERKKARASAQAQVEAKSAPGADAKSGPSEETTVASETDGVQASEKPAQN